MQPDIVVLQLTGITGELRTCLYILRLGSWSVLHQAGKAQQSIAWTACPLVTKLRQAGLSHVQ